jgi:hypothetical protein
LSDDEPLIERLKTWLAREGYPVEFETANHFRSAGFRVRQGEYVGTQGGGEPRETDVIATVNHSVGDALVRIYQLVECKWSNDKPWIVFVGPGGMAPSALITQTIASRTGRALLWARAGDPALRPLSLFDTPDSPAFNGRQAFGEKADVFYATLQSVVSKASLLAQEYDRDDSKLRRTLDMAVVVFPMVVLQGLLFQASFDATTHYGYQTSPPYANSLARHDIVALACNGRYSRCNRTIRFCEAAPQRHARAGETTRDCLAGTPSVLEC